MENTKSFFGPNGLSSTSANHYANLAKETSRNILSRLAGMKFYSTDISIIGDSTGGEISRGIKSDDLTGIHLDLQRLSKLNSLIAFFREAIKEKERLLKEAKNWEDTEARADVENQIREHSLRKPIQPITLTEDDIIKSWSIGEQEKYLSLEAEASVYGKFIHEDGSLSAARQDLMYRITNPISVIEKGRDTIIYKYMPTVSQGEVDDCFFNLQQHYRKVQAELNGMKKSIADALNQTNLKNLEEYRLEMQKWNLQNHELSVKLQDISEREKTTRLQKADEVQKLKIVVPKRLQDIYEELQKLG